MLFLTARNRPCKLRRWASERTVDRYVRRLVAFLVVEVGLALVGEGRGKVPAAVAPVRRAGDAHDHLVHPSRPLRAGRSSELVVRVPGQIAPDRARELARAGGWTIEPNRRLDVDSGRRLPLVGLVRPEVAAVEIAAA